MEGINHLLHFKSFIDQEPLQRNYLYSCPMQCQLCWELVWEGVPALQPFLSKVGMVMATSGLVKLVADVILH